MVELVILDGKNFKIKDYTMCKDYVIIVDSIVQSTSTFNILNKTLNAKSDDIIVSRSKFREYIGVISSVVTNESGMIKISSLHFSSRLDITYLGASKADINLGDYLKEVIENNLINSDDALQNIKYLKVINESKIVGAVSLKANAAANLWSVITTILKSYELVIRYRIRYDNQGGMEGITILIKDVDTTLTIKENESFIVNSNVVDGRIGGINKIIFYPNSGNILYKDILSYYLLNDGSITNDSKNNNRLTPVISEVAYYQDADVYYDELNKNPGATLMAKVRERFASTTYNHYISLTINKNNALDPRLIYLGNRVYFYSKSGKVYKTIITKLRHTGLGDSVEVELGLNRISLTDKLAMRGDK